MLALVGWPISKATARLATLDRTSVLSVALVLAFVGVFSLHQSVFDVVVVVVFGFVGYFMLRYGYSVAASALGLLLGPGLESNFRQGLLLMEGSYVAFFTRPITLFIVFLSLGAMVYGIFSGAATVRGKKTPPARATLWHLPTCLPKDGAATANGMSRPDPWLDGRIRTAAYVGILVARL